MTVNGRPSCSPIVQTFDGFAGGVVVRHLDEAEAFASTRVAVLDDFGTPYGAILGEHFFKLGPSTL